MDAITATKSWLKNFVIKLGLCPFAYEVVANDKVKYAVLELTNTEKFLADISSHIDEILGSESNKTTAILIVEHGLDNFMDFLEVYDAVDIWLNQKGLDEQIQLASFHPDYQFAGTAPSDVENYTNRSPYPIIHLLRIEDVSAAIDSHADISQVPLDNIKKMKELGEAALLKLLNGMTKS